jgi:hypothetical protein
MSTYEAPSIKELGSVEEFTGGPGGGFSDNLLASIGVVVGDGDGGWIPPYGSN